MTRSTRGMTGRPSVTAPSRSFKHPAHQFPPPLIERYGMVCASLAAMKQKRLSMAEAEAYGVLQVALTDLRKAERVLAASIEDTPLDLERAAYLAAVRATIVRLHLTFVSQN